MLWFTGFLGLARISLCFWAHTDLTDPTVLLCGWEISQIGSVCGWLSSHRIIGLHRVGFNTIKWIISWDLWDLCEAVLPQTSARYVWGGWQNYKKLCDLGGVLKDLKKKCGKSCYIKKFLQSLRVKYETWVGQVTLLPATWRKTDYNSK